MDRMDFTQAVVRTRVLEKKLLSRPMFERMIEAKDLEEVFTILNETEYANGLAEINRNEDYEQLLAAELIRVYETMREISPDPKVTDFMVLKYDYHNLKVLIKENFLNKDLSHLYLPIGISDFEEVKQALLKGDLREILPEFKEAIESVQKDFGETGDPQRIDILLDHFYIKHLYQTAMDSGIELFIEYAKAMIDFINIRSIIRLQKMKKDIHFAKDVILPNGNIDAEVILFSLNDPIDQIIYKFRNEEISKFLIKGLEAYKETGRLSDFEKGMDDYLVDVSRQSKSVYFGPEPIFSYVVAKETEIKNLRIIMVSKLNHISPEATRERVRELYA